ncbi:hypothetical protein [Parabacteroides goldsteinii]|uniref:hypothetical protein n=1 Tax=Parabacteroides goldsteinii TaxID=328812 RepID=UPI0032B2FE8E
MELNINEIASAKIQSMYESGEIRKRIEEGVEKSIYSAIDSACKDYQFRSTIEKNIESVLGEVAKGVNVDAYKNFLISRLNKAFSSHVKKDIGDKIEAILSGFILILRKKSNYPSLLRNTKNGCSLNLMKKNVEIGKSLIFLLTRNIVTGLMLNLKSQILTGLRN